MPTVVGIRFYPAGKIYFFEAGEVNLFVHDTAIVSAGGGIAAGVVVVEPRQVARWPEELRPVLRKADARDMAALQRLREREKAAEDLCREYIRELNLEMRLSKVEYLLSGNKAIFSFTSENRVDFRELVRRLARQLHVKVEMRQVGVRDESGMLGGVGVCGCQMCCSTWLGNFFQVSIRMAKDQNLSLNPEKVSGQCGRLLCCIQYEHPVYKEELKGLPKLGKRCNCPHGEGRCVDINIFKGVMAVSLPPKPDERQGEVVQYDVERYRRWAAGEDLAPDAVIREPDEAVSVTQQAQNDVASFEEDQRRRLQERGRDADQPGQSSGQPPRQGGGEARREPRDRRDRRDRGPRQGQAQGPSQGQERRQGGASSEQPRPPRQNTTGQPAGEPQRNRQETSRERPPAQPHDGAAPDSGAAPRDAAGGEEHRPHRSHRGGRRRRGKGGGAHGGPAGGGESGGGGAPPGHGE